MGDEDVWDILERPPGDAVDDLQEDKDEELQNFLWLVEAALLAVDELVKLPPPPVSMELSVECAALLDLVKAARAGDLPGVLDNPWLSPLREVLPPVDTAAALSAATWTCPGEFEGGGEGEDGLAVLRERLQQRTVDFTSSAPGGAGPVRRLAVLSVAVAALQLYGRLNWTGPAVESDSEMGRRSPFDCSSMAVESAVGKLLLQALEVDGEPMYELVRGPGHLWLAAVLLGALPQPRPRPSLLAGGWSLRIWLARCAFAWQLSLAEASERGLGQSPWLFKLSLGDLALAPEAEGGTLLAALLAPGPLAELQATTQPVLRGCSKGPTVAEAALDKGGRPLALTSGAWEESDQEAQTLARALALAPATVRAALLLEVSVRLCWYGRTRAWEALQSASCEQLSFYYEITGVLGIKRQYQTEEFSQLAVKAGARARAHLSQAQAASDSQASVASPSVSTGLCPSSGEDREVKLPENLALSSVDDLTDVLERTKLSQSINKEERELLEEPLGAVEQLILLSKCHELWVMGNPNDELLLQQVNALAQRVLQVQGSPQPCQGSEALLTANWLSFSCGLYYRCRAEHHRNKTRERASFQLQALVDQFDDAHPTAAHRLLLVHAAGYPARFHLQREMGMRMMRMGMVSTAYNEFKKLRMWPEAIDCLMVAERHAEALDLVHELLAANPTPRLWCCLGDLEHDPRHYEKAWELSKGHFARAQRSLGRHFFQKNELEKAVEAFSLALDINPLHSDIWFTQGCAQLRLERFEDAAVTFSRCISVKDEHGEAWANLAATHSARGKLQEARNCMVEATRRCRENWRMWESFLGICMQLRDVQGCIQGMRRLTELGQERRLREQVLGLMTAAVVSDQEGLYDHRTGRAFAGQLEDFFRFLTSKRASEPCYWQLWAELQSSLGRPQEALQSRLKQMRAAKARAFEERDPEAFASQLQDLRECLEVLDALLTRGDAGAHEQEQLRAFTDSVREIEQQLRSRLESSLLQPSWLSAHEAIQALSSRLEAAGGCLRP